MLVTPSKEPSRQTSGFDTRKTVQQERGRSQSSRSYEERFRCLCLPTTRCQRLQPYHTTGRGSRRRGRVHSQEGHAWSSMGRPLRRLRPTQVPRVPLEKRRDRFRCSAGAKRLCHHLHAVSSVMTLSRESSHPTRPSKVAPSAHLLEYSATPSPAARSSWCQSCLQPLPSSPHRSPEVQGQ